MSTEISKVVLAITLAIIIAMALIYIFKISSKVAYIAGSSTAMFSTTTADTGTAASSTEVMATTTPSLAFGGYGILNETGNITESRSSYWWVNSGGELILNNGTATTMIGDASSTNQWYLTYEKTNPTETDQGLHPQNIFRLVTLSTWTNYMEEGHFYILGDNFSNSPTRDESNGLLLFNRYVLGGQTLYYAGIRVDGTAVIKKKYKGTYFTMAQTKVFPGDYNGTRDNVNLIPQDTWVGLKDSAITNTDGSVTVTLYVELPGQTTWTQVLQATDKGQYDSTPAITNAGHAGIRTDYMDVKFSNFSVTPL